MMGVKGLWGGGYLWDAGRGWVGGGGVQMWLWPRGGAQIQIFTSQSPVDNLCSNISRFSRSRGTCLPLCF